MRRYALTLALAVLSTQAVCWAKQMDFDCRELAPGASQSYLQTFPVRNKFVGQLTVAVTARNVGPAEAPKCHITWAVSGSSRGRSRPLFRYTDQPAGLINGVAFEGTSPDGSKLLLDFFSTVGDLTDHRPAVFDFLTLGYQIRDVGDKVTRNLPDCKYFTMLSGVTDQGEVILYVPKSIYVDAGCPDQGEWLMNMRTGTITRVEAHAPPETQSRR